jgi:hypothetical protein
MAEPAARQRRITTVSFTDVKKDPMRANGWLESAFVFMDHPLKR